MRNSKRDHGLSTHLNGIEVISTTCLATLLGVNMKSSSIKELNVCSPIAEINGTIWWRYTHIPIIAMAMAKKLSDVAITYQLINNLELEQ